MNLKHLYTVFLLCISTIALSQTFETYLKKGDKLYEAQKYKKATKYYSKAIALDSLSAVLYFKRGMAQCHVGLNPGKEKYLQNAINDFTYAIRLDTNYAFAYMQRALTKYEMSLSQQTMDDYGAIDDLEKAIELDTSLKDLQYTIGLIQIYVLQDFAAAEKSFTEVIKRGNNDPALFWARGDFRMNAQNYKGAIEDYRAIISLDSIKSNRYANPLMAHVRIGDCFVKMNQYKAAELAYTDALKIHPTYNVALNLRGNARYQMKDSAGACNDWHMSKNLSKMELELYCNHTHEKQNNRLKKRHGVYLRDDE